MTKENKNKLASLILWIFGALVFLSLMALFLTALISDPMALLTVIAMCAGAGLVIWALHQKYGPL